MYRSDLEVLRPISPDDCKEILSLCREHGALAAYQGKTAAMGRTLVQGEVDLFRLFPEEESKRVACLALLRPVECGAV